MDDCLKVPIWNVSPCDSINVNEHSIQTVLNDYTTVRSYNDNYNINLADIFVSPNIVDDYIDPNWCAGDTPKERFNELSIDDPISCYDYIQYGGCEKLPEIYFENIIDRTDTDHAIHYIDQDSVLHIYMQPDEYAIKSYYNATLPTTPLDKVGWFRSLLYRDDDVANVGDRKLRVKVGSNISNGSLRFKIKITGYLAGEKVEDNVFEYDPINGKNKWLFPVLIGVSAGAIASGIPGALKDEVGHYFDYLLGKENPVYKGVEFLIDKIEVAHGSSLAGTIMIELSVIAATIVFIDFIVKLFTNIKQPDNYTGIYNLTTGGLYNRFDVRDSNVDVKIGNPYDTVTLNKVGTYTIKDGEFYTKEYTIEIPASKYPISEDDYFVLDFTAIGNQYNAITPLPGAFFHIELIPISGCTLSETKHVRFTTTIFPDRITPPSFSIEPSIIYKNTNVVINNALYCDYIAGQDLEADYGWLGLGKYYYYFTLNGNTNETGNRDWYHEFTGTNIFGSGDSIFHIDNTIKGRYNMLFMLEQERYTQRVYNYTFIDRNHSFDEKYQDAVVYWVYNPDDWEIKSGALRRVGIGNSEVYQDGVVEPTINWPGLYYIDINIEYNTGGRFYINCANVFDGVLYNPKSQDLTKPNIIAVPNVSYSNNKLYFNANGNFKIVTKATSNAISRLSIGSESTFNGYVTHIKVHRMNPKDSAVKRGLTLAQQQILLVNDYDWVGNHIKIWFGYSASEGQTKELSITLGNFTKETTMRVCWDWSDYKGDTDRDRLLNNDWDEVLFQIGDPSTYTFSHTYNQPKFVYEVRIMVSDPANIWGYTILPYLEIHNSGVVGIESKANILHGSTVDLSNCNLGGFSISNYNVPPLLLDPKFDLLAATDYKAFNNVKSLNISNNVNFQWDTFNLQGVTDILIANNTKLNGDLNYLYAKERIEIYNTRVNKYSSFNSIYCKNIKWYDTTPGISVTSLNNLVRDLYNSSIRDGTLYIASDNPNIIDDEILWFIFQLVHYEDWTIIYNGYYITAENRDNYLQTGKDDYVYTK